MIEINKYEPEPVPKYQNFLAAYEAIVGFPFPRNPEQLPPEFLLPPATYGELITAILNQETVDLANGLAPRERAQLVGLLNFKGEAYDSKVSVGTEDRAGNAPLTLARWFRPFIGLTSKPITYWHTHPPKHSSLPALDDILHAVAEDREGTIYIVGSQTDITVIMQTETAVPHHLPLSTFHKGFKLYDEIVNFYDDSAEPQPDLPKLAAYLQEKGLAIYRWKKGTDTSVIQAAQTGKFKQGILLQRVFG